MILFYSFNLKIIKAFRPFFSTNTWHFALRSGNAEWLVNSRKTYWRASVDFAICRHFYEQKIREITEIPTFSPPQGGRRRKMEEFLA